MIHYIVFSVELVVYWLCYFFFFKQKTAYEMRISDWSSDVCSSDLVRPARGRVEAVYDTRGGRRLRAVHRAPLGSRHGVIFSEAQRRADVRLGHWRGLDLAGRVPRLPAAARLGGAVVADTRVKPRLDTAALACPYTRPGWSQVRNV